MANYGDYSLIRFENSNHIDLFSKYQQCLESYDISSLFKYRMKLKSVDLL